jgi:hypothetical protein
MPFNGMREYVDRRRNQPVVMEAQRLDCDAAGDLSHCLGDESVATTRTRRRQFPVRPRATPFATDTSFGAALTRDWIRHRRA